VQIGVLRGILEIRSWLLYTEANEQGCTASGEVSEYFSSSFGLPVVTMEDVAIGDDDLEEVLDLGGRGGFWVVVLTVGIGVEKTDVGRIDFSNGVGTEEKMEEGVSIGGEEDFLELSTGEERGRATESGLKFREVVRPRRYDLASEGREPSLSKRCKVDNAEITSSGG